MNDEIWKKVSEVEGYLISSVGRVKSLKRNAPKILKPKIDKDGYHEYGLYCTTKGKVVHRRAHRLVASAFIPNPDNLPIINHKNLIKDDNRISNLEWCDYTHNTVHGYKNQPHKRIGKGLCDLSKEDLLVALELYNSGYTYGQLNDHFDLEVKQSLWGDVFKGRRFSAITGIISDVRTTENNPSYTKTESDVLSILECYFKGGLGQTDICNKYQLNPSYVSRIVNRKKRVDIYDSFMEKLNA